MSTRIIIETDEPCIVLVLLPRRVEPRKRAPRRVIQVTGETLPDSQRNLRKTVPPAPLQLVASK